MIVCHCHAVTDREIRQVAAQGAQSRVDVTRACRAGGDCGGCHPHVELILRGLHGRGTAARQASVAV